MVDWEYRDALCPHCCSMTPCAYNKLNNKYLCRWCSKVFTISEEDYEVGSMRDMEHDIRYLIELAKRCARSPDLPEVNKLERKYFEN